MNCDAAIFDLDGTILDSLWVWEDISKDFLSKKGKGYSSYLYTRIVFKKFSRSSRIYYKIIHVK